MLTMGARVGQPEFNQFDVLTAASALVGRPVAYRCARCFGQPPPTDVEFESPKRVRQWLPELKATIENSAFEAALPAVALAQTIIYHPVTEGNGRLARFLCRALMLHGTNAVAPVALAPALYANRLAFAQSLLRVCETGEWQEYYELFCDIVESATQTAERSGN